MGEFDFIRQYLQRQQSGAEVVLGIGDDAAIVRPLPGLDWCISTDMLLAGRHFFADEAAADIAHKVLAVNLSDMAAMGAQPRWALLSAALPQLNPVWLSSFCDSLFSLAAAHGVTLIGGDTTRGDYVFNITIGGTVLRVVVVDYTHPDDLELVMRRDIIAEVDYAAAAALGMLEVGRLPGTLILWPPEAAGRHKWL